ncbi:hypothetical protein JOM56_015089 [Amanita muscaria]
MANRNAEFYFQDIVFRVEDQLFKVPRRMFVQHSQVFRDMFDIPIPAGTEPDGCSDEQPLILETIEKKDFIPLLRCLYPPQFQRVTGHDFSLDEWKSVLKLANLYEMTDVKDFAVDCMTPLLDIGSPPVQIHLAQAHDVPKWLQPAKARLVDRSNPINENDVVLIGLALALEVCALRENALRENTFTTTPNLSPLGESDQEKSEPSASPWGPKRKIGRSPTARAAPIPGRFGVANSSG